eukprot:139579-Prymnesium_polylepis.1
MSISGSGADSKQIASIAKQFEHKTFEAAASEQDYVRNIEEKLKSIAKNAQPQQEPQTQPCGSAVNPNAAPGPVSSGSGSSGDSQKKQKLTPTLGAPGAPKVETPEPTTAGLSWAAAPPSDGCGV